MWQVREGEKGLTNWPVLEKIAAVVAFKAKTGKQRVFRLSQFGWHGMKE
jgi:hypothetical protein